MDYYSASSSSLSLSLSLSLSQLGSELDQQSFSCKAEHDSRGLISAFFEA